MKRRSVRLVLRRLRNYPGAFEPDTEPEPTSSVGGAGLANARFEPAPLETPSSVEGRAIAADSGASRTLSEIAPADAEKAPDAVEALLKALTWPPDVRPDSDRGNLARDELEKGKLREVEERLDGLVETADEANILGIAFAHLAHKHHEPHLWQRAADEFARSERLAPASDERRARATTNCDAVEAHFGIRAAERGRCDG